MLEGMIISIGDPPSIESVFGEKSNPKYMFEKKKFTIKNLLKKWHVKSKKRKERKKKEERRKKQINLRTIETEDKRRGESFGVP